jgi:hypothetical protein
MSDKIKVTLSPTILEVNAGESVELTATIHNRSQVVDQFTIALEELAPSWYDFSVSSVSLFPGDKDQIKVTLHPPKTAETKAGSYPFTVRAISGADPQQSTVAEASVEVHTFAELSADMSPTRLVGQSGTYIITLNNQGNADVTQSFEASDPEEGLDYTFKPEEVTVPAGGSATVELVAKLKKKPKVDGEKEYPFQVVVKPSGADKFSPEAKTLNGQLVYERKARPKPKIPRWLIGVLAGVAVAIIVILLLRGCGGPPEIIEFAFNYTATDQGYELHWVINNAGEGDINGEALEDAQLEEGVLLADPCINTVYVLTASNRAGAANATVIIPPCISFSAEWLGCEFALNWTTEGADQVYLNDEPVDTEGDTIMYPDRPVGYNLNAKNEGGAAEKILTIAPATVTVTLPNGGEMGICGSSEDITWTSMEPRIDDSGVTSGIHHVGLEYSSDGGQAWHTIDTNEPDDGSYSWILPSTPSTTCLVRATVYCAEGDVLGQDTSDDFFTITGECTVDLLTPEEGEVIDTMVLDCTSMVACFWIPNAYEVTWESEGVCIDHVALSYSVEGGSWQTIADNLPDTGSYTWTVPSYECASGFLRITIYDSANNTLCSDSHGLTIASQCTVSLVTPGVEEILGSGTAYAVTWESEGGCTDHVELSYRTGSGSWQTIADNLPNTGSYTWTVPNLYSSNCYLRIVIYNSADRISCSYIKGPFIILVPPM